LIAYVKPYILEKLKGAALAGGVDVDFKEIYVVIAKEA
jgi:hypothetical protein